LYQNTQKQQVSIRGTKNTLYIKLTDQFPTKHKTYSQMSDP